MTDHLPSRDDFPKKLRDHCMERVKHWKNSDQFIRLMELEFDRQFGKEPDSGR